MQPLDIRDDTGARPVLAERLDDEGRLVAFSDQDGLGAGERLILGFEAEERPDR